MSHCTSAKREKDRLDHVAHNAIRLTGPSVVGRVTLAEELESPRYVRCGYLIHDITKGKGYSRVTLYAVRLAKFSLVDTVYLGEPDVALFQAGSCLFIMRSQRLAVTTPAVVSWVW